jgi:hypothetical protein
LIPAIGRPPSIFFRAGEISGALAWAVMGSASAVNTSKPALNNDFFMALMRDDRARYIEEITVIALFRWKGKHSNLIKLLLNIYLPNFLILIFEKLNFSIYVNNYEFANSSRSVYWCR